MLESDRNAVFAAQTENVRALEQAWKHINKAINAAYSSGDTSSSEIHTKLLAQVYCAFAEAVFSKVIHTPNGLDLDEIAQVKAKGKKNIVEAWKKCVELSLRRVQGRSSGHVANTRLRSGLESELVWLPNRPFCPLLKHRLLHKLKPYVRIIRRNKSKRLKIRLNNI